MSKIIPGGTRIGGELGGAIILAGCSLVNVGGPADTPAAGPPVRTSAVARAALRSA